MFDMFASPSFYQHAAVNTFIDRRRERGVGGKKEEVEIFLMSSVTLNFLVFILGDFLKKDDVFEREENGFCHLRWAVTLKIHLIE